jgi:hypothetical protein
VIGHFVVFYSLHSLKFMKDFIPDLPVKTTSEMCTLGDGGGRGQF